jgi:hypothetical protein
MVAGPSACTCEQCGTTCTGKFSGCSAVWARGPQQFAASLTVGRAAPRAAAPPVDASLTDAVERLHAELDEVTRRLAEQHTAFEMLVGRLQARTPVARAAGAADGDEPPVDALSRIERVAYELGDSLALTATVLGDLRAETQRVASVGQLAHASLAVARQIERTTARVDERLDELGAGLEAVRSRVDQLFPAGAQPVPTASD